MDKKPTVAVILPVANERAIIRDTLTHLLSLGADEIVVVDGASRDGTFEMVREGFPAVKCLQAAGRDRALQMNTGAFEAASDVLLFAHADMRLPSNAVEIIRQRIRSGFVGGGFKKCYAPSSALLSVYCFFLNWIYFSWMRSLVGTNAIFVRRDVFQKIRGFGEGVFMEDVLFSDKLKKEGRVSTVAEPVLVSSRRYFRSGVLRQILRNAEIIFRHRILRQDPFFLKGIYETQTVKGGG